MRARPQQRRVRCALAETLVADDEENLVAAVEDLGEDDGPPSVPPHRFWRKVGFLADAALVKNGVAASAET
jgi:hypothetical protein